MVPFALLQGGFRRPALVGLEAILVEQRAETDGSLREAKLEAFVFPREAGHGGR